MASIRLDFPELFGSTTRNTFSGKSSVSAPPDPEPKKILAVASASRSLFISLLLSDQWLLILRHKGNKGHSEFQDVALGFTVYKPGNRPPRESKGQLLADAPHSMAKCSAPRSPADVRIRRITATISPVFLMATRSLALEVHHASASCLVPLSDEGGFCAPGAREASVQEIIGHLCDARGISKLSCVTLAGATRTSCMDSSRTTDVGRSPLRTA